jgi:uncharacterized membrane protein YhaH (DUF805 family)
MYWRAFFLSGKGRVGRADFWTAWFLLTIASAVFSRLAPAGVLVGLFAGYPQICLLARRLHDRGKSGWWTAAILGVFFAAALASEVARAPEWAQPPSWATDDVQTGAGLLSILIAIVGIALFLHAGLARGDLGENHYGPPELPKLSRIGPQGSSTRT